MWGFKLNLGYFRLVSRGCFCVWFTFGFSFESFGFSFGSFGFSCSPRKVYVVIFLIAPPGSCSKIYATSNFNWAQQQTHNLHVSAWESVSASRYECRLYATCAILSTARTSQVHDINTLTTHGRCITCHVAFHRSGLHKVICCQLHCCCTTSTITCHLQDCRSLSY